MLYAYVEPPWRGTDKHHAAFVAEGGLRTVSDIACDRKAADIKLFASQATLPYQSARCLQRT